MLIICHTPIPSIFDVLLLCLIILHVCVSQEELEEPTVPEIMEVVVEAGEEEGTMEVETEVVGEEEVTDTSIKYQTTFPCSFDLLNCFVSLFNLIHFVSERLWPRWWWVRAGWTNEHGRHGGHDEQSTNDGHASCHDQYDAGQGRVRRLSLNLILHN